MVGGEEGGHPYLYLLRQTRTDDSLSTESLPFTGVPVPDRGTFSTLIGVYTVVALTTPKATSKVRSTVHTHNGTKTRRPGPGLPYDFTMLVCVHSSSDEEDTILNSRRNPERPRLSGRRVGL